MFKKNSSLRFFLLFSLLFSLIAITIGVIPTTRLKCVYHTSSDYPVCSNCTNPVPISLFDFSLPNLSNSSNNCNLTYLNPGYINVQNQVAITSAMAATITGYSINSSVTLQVLAFETSALGFIMYFNNTPTFNVFYICEINGIVCSPFHSPFSVFGFNQTVSLVGQASTLNQPCVCTIIGSWLTVLAQDKGGNNCSFSNYTLNNNPYIHAYGCMDYNVTTTPPELYYPTSNKRGIYLPAQSLTDSSHDLTCIATYLNNLTYILVQKADINTTTIMLDWQNTIFREDVFIGDVKNILIPSQISNIGGVVSITINYPDFTWSACDVVLTGLDVCLQPNMGLWNSPWHCLSWESQMILSLSDIALIIACILALVVMVYLFTKLIFYILGCCVVTSRFGKTKIGTKLGGLMAAGASQFSEVEALNINVYEDIMSSFTVYIGFIATLALFIAIIIVLLKFVKYRTLKRIVTGKSGLNTKDFFMLPILFMVCICSVNACNSNFLLTSNNYICTGTTNKTCSLNTVLQTSLPAPGSCMELSSTNSKTPFSITFTLAGAGLLLHTDFWYYSQLAECYSPPECQGVCDYSNNDGGLSQCTEFNSYGPGCTTVNSDHTGFPSNTKNAFTRCQCEYFEDVDCPSSLGDVTKNFGYSEVIPISNIFPVLEVVSYTNVYIITVDIEDATSNSFNCYVTPFHSYCPDNNISISFISSQSVINTIENVFLFEYNDTAHYYSSYASPIGQANTCNLGNIQTTVNGIANTGTSTSIVYQDFCNLQFTSTFSSCSQIGCSNSPADYGKLLPYDVPGLGHLSYINDVDSGFTGYVVNTGTLANGLTFDIALNGNFTFEVIDSTVCPSATAPGNINGCYNCDTAAAFTIDIRSTCDVGGATVFCKGGTILNPFVKLTNSLQTFTMLFYANSGNPVLQCDVTASTTSSFTVSSSTTLVQGSVQLENNNNGTYHPYQYYNYDNGLLNKNMNLAELIIIGAVLLMLICCFVVMIGYCLMKCF